MAYVKKEQILDHIKNFYEQVHDLSPKSKNMIAAFRAYIEHLPEEDVVEVTRCEKCNRAKPLIFKGFFFCKKYRACREGKQFCDYGKEK